MSTLKAHAWLVFCIMVVFFVSGCPNSTAPILTAAFDADITSGNVPLTVHFTDNSTLSESGASIITWDWNFGDGSVGTDQNPEHTYMEAGIYSVSLTITTTEEEANLTKTGYIEVLSTSLSASFSASTQTGTPGQSIQFTDTSVPGASPITSWAWDFGDGTTSSDQSPSHTYTVQGTYTVSLTVTSTEGSDTVTESDFIVISLPINPPTARFSLNVTEGLPGTTVEFTDTSVSTTSDISTWDWDFGDPGSGVANTSTEQNPEHIYTEAGIYTVSLTVTNATASNTTVQQEVLAIVANVELAASLRLFDTVGYTVWDAARIFEEAFNTAVAEQGFDTAIDIIDSVLTSEIQSENDLLYLMRRFDMLGGAEVHPPMAMNSAKQPDEVEPCNGTTIVHINGMNVMYPSFVANVNALGSAVMGHPSFQGEDIEIYGIYQRSATDAQQSYFGGIICPLVGTNFPSLRNRMAEICEQGGFFIDLAEAGQQKLQDWVLLPEILDNPSQTFDYYRITNSFVNEVRAKARSLIVVPHSQGNFFTRDVIQELGFDEFGNYADAIAVVQVASPTSTMPEPTTRVDVCQDPVSLLSNQVISEFCHPWHENPTSEPTIDAHDFVTSYLATTPTNSARGEILDEINSFLRELTNPRAQSDLEVEPLQHTLSPDVPIEQITLSIKTPGLGDLSWTAEAPDPRIDIDINQGVLTDGVEPPDTATLMVSVNNFSEAFLGDVIIRNDCIPDDEITVQIRVEGEGLTIIDFDDIDGTGNQVFDGNRYAEYGLYISTEESLQALIGNDDAASSPTSICGINGMGGCSGVITLDFSPPVKVVSFYVGDQERDRKEQFSIEVQDDQGNSIDYILTRIDRRFFTFKDDAISKVILTPSEDLENIDSLSFIR